MRRFPEFMIPQIFHIAHMETSDAVHLSKMTDDRGNVVVRIGAQGAGAQAYGVVGGIVQFDDLVIVLLAVGNPGKAKDRPGGIVGMAGHHNAAFLTGGDDTIQKIFIVGPQVIRCDGFIPFEGTLQLRQPLRFPSRQGEAIAVVDGVAHQIHGGHISQLRLVKIQAVGAVLRDFPRQIGAKPVKHRHKIVYNHLHPIFGQITDGLAIIFDIAIPRGESHLDVLMYIDRLDHFALQSGCVYLVDIGFDLLLAPHIPRCFVIQKSHNARHTWNLFDLLEGHAVAVGTIPTECHLHMYCLPVTKIIENSRNIFCSGSIHP